MRQDHTTSSGASADGGSTQEVEQRPLADYDTAFGLDNDEAVA
jgi:hypothetical protein